MDQRTKEPIIGACVFIQKNNLGGVADNDGNYIIKVPCDGNYVIEVSSLGYKSVKQTIFINQNSTKDFYLEESVKVLDEVVVKASSHQAEINHIRKSPMAVSVIDGSKLRGRSSGIEDVLSRTSGLKVRKSGGIGSSSRMSIHGLEGKRVAIYVDGFPLNSPDGSFDINDMPIDVIKYIEVYKGIVPAEYGSDGLGGAINIVTREDECDLVGFTQELASFGTSKTLFSVQKNIEKQGILIGGGFFHNKSDNDYTMTYPVFETNLPESAYRKVKRSNDYYQSTMYNFQLIFTKLWFDKIKLEFPYYNNKKGIQSLDFDSQSAHTHGTNVMPTLTVEKKDFIVPNLELKYNTVTPIVHTHLVDTAGTKRQWDGTITNSMGETTDNLYNNSDDKQIETRHKLNLKYKLNLQHTFNLNNQFTYSKYRPKDDYIAVYVGFDPSRFPSNMNGNALGLTHEYSSRNRTFQNSLMLNLYYLNSEVYRTMDQVTDNSQSAKKEPGKTSVSGIYYGISEGFSYEFARGIRGKFSISHNVRLPDTEELFGDGITIKPSVDLKPEVSNNLNLGLIMDRNDFIGLSRFQFETNLYYMYLTDMISLFPANLRMIYTNLGKTQIMGFDFDLKLDITPKLYSYFNLTCQDIKDKLKWKTEDKSIENPTYNKQVPNIPRFYFNYGLEYHTKGLLGKNELSRIYIDASYIDKFNWSWQMSDLPEQKKKWLIPQSHLVTAGFQQSFWKNKISLGFEVENIFNDESYMEFKKPLQGRTFKIKFRFNWFGDESSGGAMGQ
ncbi:MAG TPA: TonB-dependent receptor [Porphyromonadaceae bacterium]|nr:TonB-dependent receptor [Porphyromonadaceae bacterium]